MVNNLLIWKGYERGIASSFLVQANKRKLEDVVIGSGPLILPSDGFCNWGANLLESSKYDK